MSTPAATCRIILLCGLPGSGKTTLARKLAEEPHAVRLSPDEWLAGFGFDLFDEAARLYARLFEPPSQDELELYDPPPGS